MENITIHIIMSDYDYSSIRDNIDMIKQRKHGKLSRLLKKSNLNLLKANWSKLKNLNFDILIIEDEIKNALDYISVIIREKNFKNFLICTKTVSVMSLLIPNLKACPKLIIFDFDLGEKNKTNDAQRALELYNAIKNFEKWRTSVIMGFTAFENGVSIGSAQTDYCILEEAIRKNGDSVYGKSNFDGEGKQNIIRDKLMIASLKEKISLIEEKNKLLSIEKKHLEIVQRFFYNTIDSKEIKKVLSVKTPKYFNKRIIGESFAFKCLEYLIYKAVMSRGESINIKGETGSGKESVAKAIHFEQFNNLKKFEALNCAVIPKGTIESELFGHEKGAFTGATKLFRGIFERGDGGTIFLDEVHSLPINVQEKLLRVLEEKEFKRLGGEKKIKFNARIITATNIDLRNEVIKGKIRVDFYFRLNGFPITVPPLRIRGKQDIIMLAKFFLRKFYDEKKNFKRKQLSKEALDKLASFDWTDNNVRELQNMIRRVAIKTSLLNSDLISSQDVNLEDSIFAKQPNTNYVSNRKAKFTQKQLKNVLDIFEGCLEAINELIEKEIDENGKKYKLEYDDITINHIAKYLGYTSRVGITGKFKKESNNWYKAKQLMQEPAFNQKYKSVIEKISPLRKIKLGTYTP